MKNSQVYEDLRESYIRERTQAKLLLVQNHPERPKIVSNRPIPREARGGARRWDHFYPFEEMKIGDSFWVASEKGARGCTAGAITWFAKKSGWKFVSRGQAEDGKSNSEVCGKKKGLRGMRVWRLA